MSVFDELCRTVERAQRAPLLVKAELLEDALQLALLLLKEHDEKIRKLTGVIEDEP